MISSKVAKSIKIIVHLRQFCLTEILLTVRIQFADTSMSTVLPYYEGLYLLYSHTTTSRPPKKLFRS